MSLRKISNEHMSEILFNLSINEGTDKMLKLVQRAFEEPGI